MPEIKRKYWVSSSSEGFGTYRVDEWDEKTKEYKEIHPLEKEEKIRVFLQNALIDFEVIENVK